MRGRLISWLLLALAPSTLSAQRPLNLGFERLSVDGVARPWGGRCFAVPAGAEVILDSLVYALARAACASMRRDGQGTAAASIPIRRSRP